MLPLKSIKLTTTNKGNTIINDHNFAMHTAKEISAHPEQTRTRIVVAENNAGYGELFDKTVAKIRRAVAIQQHLCFDSSPGGFEQRGMQLFSYRIFKPDKGFEDHPPAGATDGRKQRRIVLVAILQ